MAKWKYKNETTHPVYWSGHLWLAGEEIETPYPVPAELGLTCITTGDGIDPVLYHEDITLEANAKRTVELPMPKRSNKIDLLIGTLDGAATVSFLSDENTKVSIDDDRMIKSVVSWQACAKIYLTAGDAGATITLSAFEVV